MSAQRQDITPSARSQLTADMLALPRQNRSELARGYGLSRQGAYDILAQGQEALENRFAPKPAPEALSDEGFWIWVDSNTLHRVILILRAGGGVSFSVIVAVVLEAFGMHISEWNVRMVCWQGYQRAFEYQNGVKLSRVTRAAFDEMYRWGRCVLTGVCCATLFIFLSEKQFDCTKARWTVVMKRLHKSQGLNPAQVAIDGSSSLGGAVEKVWDEARLVHDIAHLRWSLKRVRWQFENKAYKAMKTALEMQKRHSRGPTKRTTQSQLEQKLAEALAKEKEAIDKADEVERWVQEAQEALNVIDPRTGHLNTLAPSQSKLKELGEKLAALGTTYATRAGSYLQGLGQKILEERQEFARVMKQLQQKHQVELAAVERAAWLWELDKQLHGATWSGTVEQVRARIEELWQELLRELGPQGAAQLVQAVFKGFSKVLAASSPAEWAHSQIGAVLKPQKRLSSGFLPLRAAYLNLTRFEEGRRQDKSPHELLTGEVIDDWLEKLGYPPRSQPYRNYKQLGWKRLVPPFEETWRNNWVRLGQEKVEPLLQLEERADEADEAA